MPGSDGPKSLVSLLFSLNARQASWVIAPSCSAGVNQWSCCATGLNAGRYHAVQTHCRRWQCEAGLSIHRCLLLLPTSLVPLFCVCVAASRWLGTPTPGRRTPRGRRPSRPGPTVSEVRRTASSCCVWAAMKPGAAVRGPAPSPALDGSGSVW